MSADGSPIEPVPASAEATGTILYEDSWAPGELVTPFPTAPPDDVDGMRAYLQAFLREQGGTDADAPSAGDYIGSGPALGAASPRYVPSASAGTVAQLGGVSGQSGTGSVSLSSTGNSDPMDIRQPVLAVNWCIAIDGLYPSRN